MHRPILFATVGNLFVAGATYAYYGVNFAAGAAAARNTARFSSVVFALALAAHFHPRFGRDYGALIRAFVAAHIVHFATVIFYHWMLFKLATPMFWALAAPGTLLLAATAFTITRMPRIHRALGYVFALAFAIALGSRLARHWLPELPLLAILIAAAVVHASNLARARSASRAASA